MSVPISIAASSYDGHEFPVMLDSLRACGAQFVEPAFIPGYSDPFDEAVFTTASARQHRRWLDASGMGCHAFSSHYDLGRPDAVDLFTRRMAFAAALGARVVNTIAATRGNTGTFFDNIEKLAHAAEALDLIIALENPGNGEDNLINTAEDGLALIAELGLAAVRLNYDAGECGDASARARQCVGGRAGGAARLCLFPCQGCGERVRGVALRAAGPGTDRL